MFKIIHTSFAPNYQKDDVLLSLKLMLGVLNKKNMATNISDRLSQMMNKKHVSFFSSGRSALYYALKAIKKSEKNEVILQAFTCVAVPNSIVWAGLKPVFVDADLHTYNINIEDLKKKINKKTLAIVVQHTFGIPAQMKEIVKIAKDNNFLVIEDCAHCLGTKHNSKFLGSLGDISILSFGRDKVLSSVFGGAVLVNNLEIAKKIKKECADLIKPPKRFVYKQLLYLIIYSISIYIYRLGLGKFLLWFSGKTGLLSKAVYPQECFLGKPEFINYTFDWRLKALLDNQLSKLSTFVNHRKKISKLYVEELNLNLPTTAYLRVPYKTRDKENFLKKASQNNIHLGNWYRSVVDPPKTNLLKINYKRCPNAEFLAKKTINLPTHINISENDAAIIIRYIKKQKQ